MKAQLSSKSFRHGFTACRLTRLPFLACLLLCSTLARAATPSNPLIELSFPEGVDVLTTNTGTLGENAFFNNVQNPSFPQFSTNIPVGTYVPSGNTYSVDLGAFTAGAYGRAVDLTNSITALPAMQALTVCGWLNTRDIARDGRIAYAMETPGGEGFELINDSIGALRLGINENAGDTASVLLLTADPNVNSNNWVYFAVTYDPTLPNNNVKYYFGRGNKLAYLDSAYTYQGGDIISSNIDFSGPFTAGNCSVVDGATRDTTSNAGNGQFRGLLDEVKVYTNALTLDQVQQAQINAVVTPVAASIITPPASKAVPEGQNAIFDVDATGSGQLTYQWKTNNVDVPGATNSSLTLPTVTAIQTGLQVRVGVSNSVGGVLGGNVTLTVVPANPHLYSLSLTEGNSKNTNSALTISQQGTIPTGNTPGALQGGGVFAQRQSTSMEAGNWPVFSTNVPSGPFAPAPTYNRYSLHMGDVLYRTDGTFAGSQGGRAVDFTNSLASPANTLGKMSAITICGWINAGSITWRGTVGNQLANALDSASANGIGLAHKSDNSLQFAVNEAVGNSTANRSSANMILNDTNHPAANWIFFAASYDGSLTVNNLNFYWGDGNNAATNDLVNPISYNRGIINATGPFTIGNFNSVNGGTARGINGENAAFFRGLIDEFHVISRVLTLGEIQQVQAAAPMPPILLLSSQTNRAVLSWAANTPPLLTGLQLQSRTDIVVGAWSNVTTATNVAGTVRSLALPLTNNQVFFRLQGQ